MNAIRIALDYDGTYTADPDLWLSFVTKAINRGHEVLIVTMRFPEELADIDPNLLDLGVEVIPTSRKAKRQFLIDNRGGLQMPNIWIDDNPLWIYEDAL